MVPIKNYLFTSNFKQHQQGKKLVSIDGKKKMRQNIITAIVQKLPF
jgi:hypothetical protein